MTKKIQKSKPTIEVMSPSVRHPLNVSPETASQIYFACHYPMLGNNELRDFMAAQYIVELPEGLGKVDWAKKHMGKYKSITEAVEGWKSNMKVFRK